jgi:hypothetical protein
VAPRAWTNLRATDLFAIARPLDSWMHSQITHVSAD